MKVISERIVNIADMEAKIQSARMCADSAFKIGTAVNFNSHAREGAT